MPIILAIEPDRRQAAHLAGVVRQQVGTELILADTTERALDAIGKRVPDLVLVPALLSPQDDAALAAALRVIAAAAHVRTLTIPVLASAPRRTTREGLLAKWRWGRAESPAPEGCDPAVFAEQISAYLLEAAAERAELESGPDVPVDAETVAIPDAQPIEGATPAPIEQAAVAMLLQEESPVAFDLLAAVLERPPITPDTAAPASHAGRQETVVAEAPTEQALIEAAVIEEHVVEMARAKETELERADVEPWVSMYLTPGRMWPPLEGVLAESPPSLDDFVAQPEPEPIAAMVGAEMAPPHALPTAEAPKREAPDWIELVASLRQDIERRRGEPTFASARSVAAPTADAGEGNGGRVVKQQKPRVKKSKPVQDEWGFFDPEQCGFSALLAKLEEITDGPEEPNACQPS